MIQNLKWLLYICRNFKAMSVLVFSLFVLLADKSNAEAIFYLMPFALAFDVYILVLLGNINKRLKNR